MSERPADNAPRVTVSDDGRWAELTIPAAMDRALVSPTLCATALQAEGVEVTAPVHDAITAMLADLPPQGQAARAVVARATEPADGDDGRIDWAEFDTTETAPDSAGGVDHYSQCAFVMVHKGDRLGRVVPPTMGTDGRDVRGKTLAAKDGKPCEFRCDDTVLCDSKGNLTADTDGALTREPHDICIRKLIEVGEYVDFSTGNIDFDGDVLIRKGVRDRFVVQASGDVEAQGLVEAATIICGGNFLARGGMAGRERGKVSVGGDLVARYLDNIQAEVGRCLRPEREIINCDVVVHGDLDSENGALIGGRAVVSGAVRIGTIGSGAGVATELVIGTVPRLEPFLAEIAPIIDQLTARRDALLSEQETIKKNARRLTATDKERQTEIMCELPGVMGQLGEALRAQQALQQRIDALTTIDVSVARRLHQGVLLRVGNRSFKMTQDVRGPLRITGTRGGDVMLRRGDSPPSLLGGVADVRLDAA